MTVVSFIDDSIVQIKRRQFSWTNKSLKTIPSFVIRIVKCFVKFRST